METNLSAWYHHQPSHLQSSYLNSLNYPFNLGALNNIPPSMSPCANIAPPNGTFSEIALFGVPYPKQYQPNEFHGWFSGLPQYSQPFTEGENTISHLKTPYFSCKNIEETKIVNPGSRPDQKRFLVFDQSGDQTTMFFSPGVGPSVRLAPEDPKLKCEYNLSNMVENDIYQHQEPILTYEYQENIKDDEESEMHEDTEEINALLYSDDEYYYEDEEEASTGHSPSTMTEFNKQDCTDNNNEEEEEVDSNFGPNKKIKLLNGGFQMSSPMDTAGAAKLKNCSEFENDAESSCGGEENREFDGFKFLGGKKRSRTYQIRETLSLLKTIIPGGNDKGKDAILIFDEAIDYLKSLKVKAQTLGVHTI